MRLIRFLIFSGIAFLVMGQSLFAQSKQGQKEQMERKVTEVLSQDCYKIIVDRAVPMAGRAVNLTSSYMLQIHGDSIWASLPYFGRAYSASYGGGGGIQFKEIASEKEVSPLKKGGSMIKFRIKTSEDTYTFQVSVFVNGASTIHVSPVNKQSISYYGDLELGLE